jgi:hypothetical protein
LRVVADDHSETLVFDVADIGDDNLILGVNWLRRHNPLIDWARSTLAFDSELCQESCLPKVVAATKVPQPSSDPRCPPRRAVLERERRAARKAA